MTTAKQNKFYYSDGTTSSTYDDTKVLHRTDGPAVEYADGSKFWYINDQRHRTDGPAIELANGDKYWYINGQRHRTDGPAVECADGNKYWYVNGQKIEG